MLIVNISNYFVCPTTGESLDAVFLTRVSCVPGVHVTIRDFGATSVQKKRGSFITGLIRAYATIKKRHISIIYRLTHFVY